MIRAGAFCAAVAGFVAIFFLALSDAGADRWKEAAIERIGPYEAPHFVLQDTDGRDFSLDSVRGKVVVLNFWATWCPPCKDEMESLDKLNRSLGADGVRVVAVNDFEPREKVVEFANRHNYSFTILVDEKGVVSERYRVVMLPTTYIIDKDGRAVAKVVGYRDWTDKTILDAIKEIARR